MDELTSVGGFSRVNMVRWEFGREMKRGEWVLKDFRRIRSDLKRFSIMKTGEKVFILNLKRN
jgi:hypothetical protein